MQYKMIIKACRYHIYPTHLQAVFFAKTFGYCRFVWNKMLDEKLRAYDTRGKNNFDSDKPVLPILKALPPLRVQK